jgi:hypothetical protein
MLSICYDQRWIINKVCDGMTLHDSYLSISGPDYFCDLEFFTVAVIYLLLSVMIYLIELKLLLIIIRPYGS